MYENYYHEELVKIRTCVKYLINAYLWCLFPWYILTFRCENWNYHGDSLSFMFPWFPVSYHFPWFFCMSSPVLLRSPRVFLMAPISVSPVSYLRFCGPGLTVFVNLERENIQFGKKTIAVYNLRVLKHFTSRDIFWSRVLFLC